MGGEGVKFGGTGEPRPGDSRGGITPSLSAPISAKNPGNISVKQLTYGFIA